MQFFLPPESGKALNAVKGIFGKKGRPEFPDEFDSLKRLLPVQIKTADFCSRLLQIIHKRPFGLIQMEFFETLDLIHLLPAGIPKIFIHHEIRFKELMTSAATSTKDIKYTDYVIQNNKAVELDLLKRFDCIVTFSNKDKIILNEYMDNRIVSIPFPVLEKEFNYKKRKPEYKKMIFIGGENHYPNVEGIKWFIENCFEAVWNKFQYPLFIIGKWSHETIKKLAVKDKIIFTGFLKDYSDLAEHAVMIIPVRIGSGIRAKALYAMANKIPVISTSIGVEGIGDEKQQYFLIADDREKFIEGLEKINNVSFTEKMLENAINFCS